MATKTLAIKNNGTIVLSADVTYDGTLFTVDHNRGSLQGNSKAVQDGDWLFNVLEVIDPLMAGRMVRVTDIILVDQGHPNMTAGSTVPLWEDRAGDAIFRAWRQAGPRLVIEMVGGATTPAVSTETGAAQPDAVPTPADDDKGKRPSFPRPDGTLYYANFWGLANDWDVNVMRRAEKMTRCGKFTPVRISSAPGAGKTALVEAAHGFVTPLGGMPDLDTSHLLGKGVVKPDGTITYEWGPLPTALTHETGSEECLSQCEQPCARHILYYDEMNLSPTTANTPLQMATDGRKRLWTSEHGFINISGLFHWIVTINPDVMGAVMLPAINSRLRLKFDLETDYSVAELLGVDTDVVGWAMNLQSRKRQGEPVHNLPSMRDLLAWRDLSEEFGSAFAWANIMHEADLSLDVWQETASERVGEPIEPLALLAGVDSE